MRSTARISGLTPVTVARWHDDLAEHARQVNDFLTHDLGLSEYEADEFWTTVKKNRRTTVQKVNAFLASVKRGVTRASNVTAFSS